MIDRKTDAQMTPPLTNFAFLSYEKKNGIHVAVGLYSKRSQKKSKRGKNISDTLGCGLCATFLFLPHFDYRHFLLDRRTAT